MPMTVSNNVRYVIIDRENFLNEAPFQELATDATKACKGLDCGTIIGAPCHKSLRYALDAPQPKVGHLSFARVVSSQAKPDAIPALVELPSTANILPPRRYRWDNINQRHRITPSWG